MGKSFQKIMAVVLMWSLAADYGRAAFSSPVSGAPRTLFMSEALALIPGEIQQGSVPSISLQKEISGHKPRHTMIAQGDEFGNPYAAIEMPKVATHFSQGKRFSTLSK